MKEITSPTSALEEMIQFKKPYQSDLMRKGPEKDPEIISDYETEMHKNGHQVTLTVDFLLVQATVFWAQAQMVLYMILWSLQQMDLL